MIENISCSYLQIRTYMWIEASLDFVITKKDIKNITFPIAK